MHDSPLGELPVYGKTRVAVSRGNVLRWFFLSGVPNERSLLVGVEEKATSQSITHLGLLRIIVLSMALWKRIRKFS
jgi:hypothetical protein